MCSHWSTPSYYKIHYPNWSPPSGGSTLSDIKIFEKVIKEIVRYRPNVCLSGGEPFCYEKWYEIANFVKSNNLKLSLQTNGSLLEENAERIVKYVDNLFLPLWPRQIYNPKNLNVEKLVKIVNKIKSSNYKGLTVEFFPEFTNDEIKNYYRDPAYIPKRFSICTTPWFDVSVEPSGELQLCPNYDIGNIKENNFKNLWNNDKAKKLRKELLKGIFTNCRTCYGIYVS